MLSKIACLAVIGLGYQAMGQSSLSSIAPSPLETTYHGWNPLAGWAAARLNEITYTLSNIGYAFPETDQPVRLYLIDCAVDNSSGWFNLNPYVKFEGYKATYQTGSQTVTTDHATKMLSIIAGSEAGIAPKTPIQVVNYNIASSTGQQSLADVASALFDAISYQNSHPEIPAVVCIAQGSETTGQSYILNSAIQNALNNGLPVIVSAGNKGANAANYSPSSNGSLNGVICVGASNTSNARLSSSNYGSAVDFYCPGQNVPSFAPANPQAGQTTPMSGTSPAAAIATGAAILELSANPLLTPQELEATLRSHVAAGAISILQIPVPEDIDYDGSPNSVEAFFGSDWSSPSSLPPALELQRTGNTSTVSFKVPDGMINPSNPSQLLPGGKWSVERRTAPDVWVKVESPSIAVGAVSNGKRSIQASFDDPSMSGSYRLEIEFFE